VRQSLRLEKQGQVEDLGLPPTTSPDSTKLHRYLQVERGLKGASLDQATQQFVSETLDQFSSVEDDASVVKRILVAVPADERSVLSAQAKTQWAALLRRHLGSIQNQTTELSSKLHRVFGSSSEAHPATVREADSL